MSTPTIDIRKLKYTVTGDWNSKTTYHILLIFRVDDVRDYEWVGDVVTDKLTLNDVYKIIENVIDGTLKSVKEPS